MELLDLGPADGGIPGLVRRIRRHLDVSQRGLAALLEVSQSVVARWETGRTSPKASVVEQLLGLARMTISLHDERGEEVEPMRDDGVRNRGGSRYPAHVDLDARTWWTPPGAEMSPFFSVQLRRSKAVGDPRITFHVGHRRHLRRRAFGLPVDHPRREQLAAEVTWLDEQREDRTRSERERQGRVRDAWARERRRTA